MKPLYRDAEVADYLTGRMAARVIQEHFKRAGVERARDLAEEQKVRLADELERVFKGECDPKLRRAVRRDEILEFVFESNLWYWIKEKSLDVICCPIVLCCILWDKITGRRRRSGYW